MYNLYIIDWMQRTQIYITEAEQLALRRLASTTGRKQSELIREAIDLFIETRNAPDRLDCLQQAKGMWVGQDFDLREVRESFDREL